MTCLERAERVLFCVVVVVVVKAVALDMSLYMKIETRRGSYQAANCLFRDHVRTRWRALGRKGMTIYGARWQPAMTRTGANTSILRACL